MKLSYRLKLIILITSLSVLLTSMCMSIFYRYSYDVTMKGLQKNLLDALTVSKLLFDDEDIEALKRLKKAVQENSNITDNYLERVSNKEYVTTLTPEKINELQSGDDFKRIVHKLNLIGYASLHKEVDFEEYILPENVVKYYAEGAYGIYIGFDSGYDDFEKKIATTLVSPAYAPIEGLWAGNPIGTMILSAMNNQEYKDIHIYVHDEIYIDPYYSCLFGLIKLVDKDGHFIAFLEIAYPTGIELGRLDRLKNTSFLLVGISFIVGLLFSYFISKRMSSSLHKLYDAAVQIKNQNYSVKVDIKNKDEFGMLSKVFNQMTSAVGETTSALKSSNERLRSITADMHDGVGAVLTSIQIASREDCAVDDKYIHTLAKQGMAEVRFLMDALEYDNCDFELLCEGVELLAAEILKPRVVSYNLAQSGLGDTEIPFNMYIDIQRVAREGFTNIIKHSDADHCDIKLSLDNGYIFLDICDNGRSLPEPLTESGRAGHRNIKFRTERYSGQFFADGDGSGYTLKASFRIPS